MKKLMFMLLILGSIQGVYAQRTDILVANSGNKI